MAKVTIYHNPRCSKSRATLGLLEDQGVNAEVVLYLEDAPSASKLDALCKMMGKEPLEITRTNEKRFKELGLSKKDKRTRKEWLRILAENPVLIERPIVVNGKQAALGRPPEDVLDIL